MIKIEINDKDIARIQRKLSSAQGGIGNPQIIAAAMMVGGQTLKRIMAVYPPVSRRKQPFKTDKQRRYVMWALRKGMIVIPYFRGQNPRSENMKARWIVRKIAGGVAVANNASYAQLVHGWQQQATYHKGTGWRTDQEVMTTEKARIVGDIRAAYIMGVNATWGQR